MREGSLTCLGSLYREGSSSSRRNSSGSSNSNSCFFCAERLGSSSEERESPVAAAPWPAPGTLFSSTTTPHPQFRYEAGCRAVHVVWKPPQGKHSDIHRCPHPLDTLLGMGLHCLGPIIRQCRTAPTMVKTPGGILIPLDNQHLGLVPHSLPSSYITGVQSMTKLPLSLTSIKVSFHSRASDDLKLFPYFD